MMPTASRTTPRCTTMPPLARPTSPRHQPTCRVRAARTDRTSARAGGGRGHGAEAEPDQRGRRRAAPAATHTTTVPTPIHTGTASRCHSTAPLILRQLSTGATAMRNSSARPTGTATVLKNGRAHGHLLLGQRLVEERVHGPQQHDEGEADEQDVVEQERPLTPERRVDPTRASATGRRARRSARSRR